MNYDEFPYLGGDNVDATTLHRFLRLCLKQNIQYGLREYYYGGNSDWAKDVMRKKGRFDRFKRLLPSLLVTAQFLAKKGAFTKYSASVMRVNDNRFLISLSYGYRMAEVVVTWNDGWKVK